MTYIKINDALYPATIDGRIVDTSWDNRESKSVTLEMSYNEVVELMPNDVEWSIVQADEIPIYDEQGNATGETQTVSEEYDNSEFCISGDITDHRDGTITIKMGKLTDVEEAYALMFGGDL